jgi:RimJ/RimL family protein N-acetyltransferase
VIELVAADPDAHLDLVDGWMREPHVAPWWGPPADVRAYLESQVALPHSQPWIATTDGVPFGYVETYRADEDPLAAHYDARPGDRGFHLLVGAEWVGTGAARRLVRRLLEPGGRVVCEPDVRNTRMLAFCRALGGEVRAELELPDKRAALVVWE